MDHRFSQFGFITLLNVGPLLGVLLFNWSPFEVLILYWLENVVIGIANLPRLLLQTDPGVRVGERLFKTAFFAIHYGAFCFGHGYILFNLFEPVNVTGFVAALTNRLQETITLLSIVGFVVVHLLELRTKDYPQSFKQVMKAPYERIVALHMTLIGGGILATKVEEPLYVLLLLIAIKIIMDIRYYRKQQRKDHTDSDDEMTQDDWDEFTDDADGA